MNHTDVIMFTRGVPPAESFPVKKLEECAVTVLERDADCLLQYGQAAGYTPLREWIAGEYHVNVDQVIIGQGSLQLLDTLVRTSLQAGYPVFLEQPTYDRVLTIFKRSGAKLIGINLQDGLLDFQMMESHLKQGELPRYFYLIPDFQNPSGAVMPLADRQKLVQMARVYGITLIEDGPYRQLRYHGTDLPTLFELAPECVIHMSSYSKLISPGLRVGFMILPPRLYAQVKEFAEDTYINTSYFNQAIALEFIQQGWLGQNLSELKALYRPRLDAILEALHEHFTGMADWIKPQGGFFVGLNLAPGIKIPAKEKIQESGLALSDSRGFFINSGEQFIRLPFCALAPDQIRTGIERLHRLFAI
jgi:2-aminoadipate transaminase